MFYYRQSIPVFLRPAYGKTCVKISLHTKDPARAKAFSYTLSAQLRAQFERLKNGMSDTNRDPAEEAERIAKAKAWLNSIPKEVPKPSPLDGMKELEKTFPDGSTLKTNSNDPLEIAAFHQEADAHHRRLLQYTPSTTPSPIEATPRPAKVSVEPVVAPSFIPPGLTLKEALRLYRQDRDRLKKKDAVNPLTEAERESNLNEFRVWHQSKAHELYQLPKPPAPVDGSEPGIDWPVAHITIPTITAYAEYLLDVRKLSFKSLQKKGSNLHLFFKWCRKKSHFPHSLAVPTEEAFTLSGNEWALITLANKRDTFTTAELQKIFDPANIKPLPRYTLTMPHQLWFPLIGLFTGGRDSEICALEVKHFWDADGVPAYFLPGTKTECAPRHIPIHPVLLDLGLLEYVEQVRKGGYELLFPYLNKGRGDSYAKTPAQNFHNLLHQLGIKTPTKIFYSFRHGLIRLISHLGAHPEWQRDYTGHAPQDVHRGVYGEAGCVQVLKREVLDIIEFKGLDLEPLKQFKGMDWKLQELVSMRTGRKEKGSATRAHNAAAKERATAARAQREKRGKDG